jgi:hypothetical protein
MIDNSFDQEIEYYDSLQYNNISEWIYNVNMTFHFSNQFVLIHMNIRSMRKNWNNFIAFINNEISQVHCIVLTETFLHAEEEKKFFIPGFQCISKPRKIKKRGGGIIMYIRENLICPTISYSDDEVESYEYMHVKVLDYNIYAIYRPPSSSKAKFLEELENNLLGKEGNCILIGDINLDLLDSSDSFVEKYENKLAISGFMKKINKATREEYYNDKLSSTCIDHIFVKHSNA